ncbi:MAG: molecular chaperone, partial [Bacillota bacterium]
IPRNDRRLVTMRFPILLAFLACIAGASAFAGQFSVTPVRIFMLPKERAAAITVTNEGDEELVMQADIFTWKQKADGGDDLELSEDLILSPPIIKLAPHARQVVRLAVLKPQAAPPAQRTYRMIVREVPEARAADKAVQVQIALAFSLPVFITPPDAKRDLACSIERVAGDAVRANCENAGRAYAQARSLDLLAADGRKIATRETGGYILPGIKRGFDLKGTAAIPAGGARLQVQLDDGTSQTFDVAVAE